MTTHVYFVKNYSCTVYTKSGLLSGMPGLALYDATGRVRASVYAVPDGHALPDPWVQNDVSFGTCWVYASTIPLLLDILRNEDPVSVTLNDQGPQVLIYTGQEPVGVGDESALAGTGYMPV